MPTSPSDAFCCLHAREAAAWAAAKRRTSRFRARRRLPAGRTPQPPEPELKPNPLETLRNFEPAEDEEYRLGKGDEIAVDFAGRPDLAAKLVVGPDGRITLPLAGEVMLDGLTRPKRRKAIEAALSTYYSNLSVQVTVTKYTANRVLLLGAVAHPGVVTFDGTPTLLEALSRGGMETGKAGTNTGPNNAPSKVSQIPERCAIYRGQRPGGVGGAQGADRVRAMPWPICACAATT